MPFGTDEFALRKWGYLTVSIVLDSCYHDSGQEHLHSVSMRRLFAPAVSESGIGALFPFGVFV
jgi:hypothetical protein